MKSLSEIKRELMKYKGLNKYMNINYLITQHHNYNNNKIIKKENFKYILDLNKMKNEKEFHKILINKIKQVFSIQMKEKKLKIIKVE